MQTRLTKAGFDTGGTDGRVGNDTMKAVKDFQTKMGLLPADGYGGLKVLARLRQGWLSVAAMPIIALRCGGARQGHAAAPPPAFMPPSITSSVPVT